MGHIQEITINEQYARINSSDPKQYTLIDFQKGKVYLINNKEKRMIQMEIIGTAAKIPQNMPQQHPWNRAVKTKLVRKGNGPRIAGYHTVKYQLKADGKVCSENYFSQQAGEVAHIKNFIQAMSNMSNSRKIKGIPLPPCQKAYDKFEAKSMDFGFPMKSTLGQKSDKVRFQIIQIKTNVTVKPEIFTLPRGYKVMNEQEMIEEGQAKRREWMEKSHQGRKY
ncbi:MAG: DUF4412 domain-containing protein [Thiotrichaceae bacterium]|nr:DUF4412 domain-containing protein [Thiotrichaceae bacterium]